jgi:hypothetical protein
MDSKEIDSTNRQPIAEIFGFPITNTSERAERYRINKLCPFNNIVSSCTKNSIEFPLGVCSVYHKQKPVIVCPIRFREDWRIISDSANLIFGFQSIWTHVGEVRLKDKHGKSAGNIDYVLVSYDENGRITDFGFLEVQAVYISGNLSGPFTAYLKNPNPEFKWPQSFNYPKPDYLSSSRKRLIPQIIAKGSILNQWHKKQVIALQTSFYDTLPELPEVNNEEADFAFLLYDLERINDERFELRLNRFVYTKFEIALQQIAKFEAGPLDEFTQILQTKLDKKRSSIESIEDFNDIVIE